jgi:uncharacterized protein
MDTQRQVLYVHGGMTFPTQEAFIDFLRTKELTIDRLRVTRDWKDNLPATLGARYDVLAPRMPNGSNAQYAEWELYFSRIVPLLSPGVILIGHSLGGVFLARYLAEHTIPVSVRATFLVAAPFDETDLDESLGAFVAPVSFDMFRAQAGLVYLYHSTDDPVVPYTHSARYLAALPHATLRTCEGMGHCNTASFPVLEDDIRALD